ncbi:MAG TPA: hypothetical protein VJ801_14350 [Polyangia bacterium]|jgi:hypothetical protein|nr:hypothetical protein [Polyangia bacterium]
MPRILFRGAFIRYADLRHEDEAGKSCRIHMTADWSDTVREHMTWEEVPDCVPKATLCGTINGKDMVLTPAGKELARHELQLTISEVSDFTLVRQKDEEGEPKGEELRFIVRTNQPGAMGLIENYVEKIGRGKAQLKISHEKQEGLFDNAKPEEDEAEEPEKKGKASAIASKGEMERASRKLQPVQ